MCILSIKVVFKYSFNLVFVLCVGLLISLSSVYANDMLARKLRAVYQVDSTCGGFPYETVTEVHRLRSGSLNSTMYSNTIF